VHSDLPLLGDIDYADVQSGDGEAEFLRFAESLDAGAGDVAEVCGGERGFGAGSDAEGEVSQGFAGFVHVQVIKRSSVNSLRLIAI